MFSRRFHCEGASLKLIPKPGGLPRCDTRSASFGRQMALVAAIAAPCWLSADLPQARLLTVFPPGAPAGATTPVIVAGADLDEASGLLFSDPRIRATSAADAPGHFNVTVPPGMSPGIVDVAVAGRFGVSNPRAFAIGSGAEWILDATNTVLSAACNLPPETIINGRLPPAQVLWFRFAGGTPGERWIARVQAVELDSRLEAGLRLVEAPDQERQQVRRDWMEFEMPASGPVFIELRDLTHQGGDDRCFRFSVSKAPRVDFTLPLMLEPGVTNRVRLFGRNLAGGRPSPLFGVDGRVLEEQTVEVVAPGEAAWDPVSAARLRRPAAASLAGRLLPWRPTEASPLPAPILFPVTRNPVVCPPPGDLARGDSLTSVTLPMEYCGLFPRRGGISGVTFEARKGEVYWIELWAERLGFPCDPFAVVQRRRPSRKSEAEPRYTDVVELNDHEANLGGPEFNTFCRDPAGRFEVPEDGTYRILVRDLFHGAAHSPQYPYRLAVRRPAPGFSLVALPIQPVGANDNDRSLHALSPVIRRGQTELIRVIALRHDGFGGEIELTASGLTPGVTADVTRIPSGQAVGHVSLTASEAAVGTAVPVITGSATADSGVLREIAVFAVTGPVEDTNDQAVPVRFAREPRLSVCETEWAPVRVSVTTTDAVEPGSDRKVRVPISVARQEGFAGAFSLRMGGRAELDKARDAPVPEKASEATLEISLGDAALPEGVHRVWLQGHVTGRYRNNPEALAQAEEALQQVEEALAAAAESEKAALDEHRKAVVERRQAAEERAKPRDVTFRVYSPPFDLRIPPVAPKNAAAP